MYAVLFSLTAKKQLEKLDKTIQKRIISVLERVKFNPQKYVKKLAGDQGYRLRVGDYRVIMDISADKLLILVIKIGHRKKIYKS